MKTNKFTGLLFILFISMIFTACKKYQIKRNQNLNISGLCSEGYKYFYGWDEYEINYEKSLSYFQEAASLASGEAMFEIGEFYSGGYVFKQNYKKAAKWYEKAVDHGYPQASFKLGVLYEYGGHGLKTNKIKSDYWYKYYKEKCEKERQ